MAIYAQERNSRELKGRQVLFRVSCGRSFSGWRFPLVRFQAKPRDFEFRNSWSFVLRNWWSFVLKYWGVCVPKDWWCFVLRDWWVSNLKVGLELLPYTGCSSSNNAPPKGCWGCKLAKFPLLALFHFILLDGAAYAWGIFSHSVHLLTCLSSPETVSQMCPKLPHTKAPLNPAILTIICDNYLHDHHHRKSSGWSPSIACGPMYHRSTRTGNPEEEKLSRMLVTRPSFCFTHFLP